MERDEALAICARVLEASAAEQTEVNLLAERTELTRFASNHIHQSVSEDNARVIVRAALGQRVGIASTNDLSAAGLADVAARATQLAALATPDDEFPGLPAPGQEPAQVAGAPATAAFGPAERAAAVQECLAMARGRGMTAAGACSATVSAHAVANSLGVRAFTELTDAHLRTVFAGPDSSGYAEAYAADARDIDAAALADLAADKCARSAVPRSVEPGRWDVILEPPAVTDMLFFLGYSAFNALACHEGRSPLCGRLGERVCAETISLVDDGLDPRGLPRPFDFEGVPRRRVDLIRDGVAVGLVHDSRTAALMGAQSTGHALGPGSTWGPVPANLFLSTGDASVEEMIAATERGLLVTRFHYTNLVDARQGMFTGMTRDGTFLIEDGAIIGGVRNLRFTEEMLGALDRTDMIGREGWLDEAAWAPALRVREFRFTGATEF